MPATRASSFPRTPVSAGDHPCRDRGVSPTPRRPLAAINPRVPMNARLPYPAREAARLAPTVHAAYDAALAPPTFDLRGDGFVARLHVPFGPAPHPAVVLLGGSQGGIG